MKKKLLSILITTIMLFTAIPFCAAIADDASFLAGDVNIDGVVDMFDYLFVKSLHFGKYEPTAEELSRADVNGDGMVDMFDYLAIKHEYFNSQPPKEDENVNNIDFIQHPFSAYTLPNTYMDLEEGDKLPSTLITNFDELEAYLQTVENDAWAEHIDIFYFAENLSDDYFDEKALLVVEINTGSAGDKINIESVWVDESGINAIVSRRRTMMPSPDVMCYYLMTAEINKSDIEGYENHSAIFRELPWELSFKANVVKAYVPSLSQNASEGRTTGVIPSMIIRSWEELAELEALCNKEHAYGLDEYKSTLGEAFFETNALAVAVGVATSGGDVFIIDHVGIDNDKNIVMEITLNEIGVTDDMQYVLAITEISKFYVKETAEIRAELQVITPEF